MNRKITLIFCFSLSLILISCKRFESDKEGTLSQTGLDIDDNSLNLLSDVIPLLEDGDVNAIIEIPSGTLEKWELDKSTGQLQLEMVNQTPRLVNYLGYPGNYGMIPRTLLPKEKGGDGDPLDILVLGPPAERGSIVKCKIIGILFLVDRGEQDDKLIAVSENSPLYEVNSVGDLDENYKGISEILLTWFTNYKGPGKMESKGFGDKNVATDLLKAAIDEYALNNTK